MIPEFPNIRTFTVGADEADDRIDRYLGLNSDLSRSRVKTLMKDGRVAVNGERILEPSHRVKSGDEISVTIPDLEDPGPGPENIPLNVVYEDDDVIVVDKPAGLVVHPAAGNWTGTLVNALIAHCGASLSGIGGVRRPGVVHRIDKETSGLLVAAKHDRAHAGLKEQFAAHGRDGRMRRVYRAIVWGAPERRRGTVDAPLARKRTDRRKMVVAEDGKRAVTHYELCEGFPVGADVPRACLIRCTLETGRTHQIRVHMSHIGHPLLGDAVYGAHFAAGARNLSDEARKRLESLNRQALHAGHLGFDHPLTGKPMRFDSALPEDMADLLYALRRMNVPSPSACGPRRSSGS